MRLFLISIFLLILTACSTWSTANVKPVGETKVEATSKDVQKSPVDIIITETDIPDREYKVLGDINVTVNKTTIFNKDPTKEQVNKKLQAEAAKIGADAVILVRYGTVGVSFFSWGSLNGKGRAIVFLK